MKTISKTFVILIYLIVGCKPSDDTDKQTLKSFFIKTKWEDFNKKTLIENKLGYILKDSVDSYHREDFFKLMKNSNYNMNYDNFYLVELISLNTERNTSRKIIALKNDDKVSYLFFEDSHESKNKEHFSDEQIEKFKYENLVVGKSRDSRGNVILITKVTGDKY